MCALMNFILDPFKGPEDWNLYRFDLLCTLNFLVLTYLELLFPKLLLYITLKSSLDMP